MTAERELDPRLLAHRLRAVDPDAYTFAVPTDDGVLVGASPELLVSRRGHEVRSNPLAGSAPRSGDPDEDRANADALIGSSKDREEHAIVVDAVAETLRPFCDGARRGTRSRSSARRRTCGTCRRGSVVCSGEPAPTALDLVAALHPTPAVAGEPRRPRSTRSPSSSRSTGVGTRVPSAGWTPRATASGRSRFAARSSAATAPSLYAGAGIVADSESGDESSTRPSASSARSSTRCAGASARAASPARASDHERLVGAVEAAAPIERSGALRRPHDHEREALLGGTRPSCDRASRAPRPAFRCSGAT